ncbi:MAG: methyltransferase [Gammaproteobacteria bacterium]|nr:MAG: methyltransferase [Gammaproteobacteria bacterium]
MNIKSQFTRHSLSYDEYNLIQKKAIQKLLNEIHPKPRSILDLGCGTGSLYKAIDWPLDYFFAVDFSEQMLAKHPRAANIECRLADFDNRSLFDDLQQRSFDRVISSSSLQWANDLDATFKNINNLNAPVAFAIFTANTFKTLFATARIPPLLRTVDQVTTLARQYFDASFETINYTLEFDDTHEMLRYIKKSGVSSARNVLDYKATKQLIRNYPLNYLEFEVLFIIE